MRKVLFAELLGPGVGSGGEDDDVRFVVEPVPPNNE
jgi:hypothetical protein